MGGQQKYPLTLKNIVLPIIHNNTLKYADKKKALDWFSSASSIYQQEITSQEHSDATKIVQDFQNPPIIEAESSQNDTNATSGAQKYSIAAEQIQKRPPNLPVATYG